MDGIVNVLKPVGMTSTDIVRWVHKRTKASKAGHIGTLDPGAAGVLPVCLGKATRLAEYHTSQGKSYRAEITFGIVTDTQDAFGTEISRIIPEITRNDLERILPNFLGQIEQLPPMYSAVRKNGKHLYEYARQGLEVDRKKRLVTIEKLKIIEWQEDSFPKALIDIECTKGTYVRTLCYDIGQALACGAHMSFLLRMRTGSFTLDSSYTLEEIDTCLVSNDHSFLLSTEWGLDLPKVIIPPNRLSAFKNGLSTGNLVIQGDILENSSPVQVFCENRFIGIGIWNNECLCPNKVLC